MWIRKTEEILIEDVESGHLEFEAFGREVWAALSKRYGSEMMSECDEDYMEIAAKHGLSQRVAYDPQKHGELSCDPEPGDMIWWWGEIGED